MSVLRTIVCLATLFVAINPLILDVCVNELLSVIDNPTPGLCREYTICLVLFHKLPQRDLSMEEIEEIEEPYQEELVSLSVGCNLNFAIVVAELRGTTMSPSTTVVSTTISSSATTTTTTTTEPSTSSTTTAATTTTTIPSTSSSTTAITTTTTKPSTSSSTTTPVSTVTETTTMSSSFPAKSTSTTTTTSPTTTTPYLTTSSTPTSTTSPSTSEITSTPSTSTSTASTSSVTPTTLTTTTTTTTVAPTRNPRPKITSSSTTARPSTTITDLVIPDCIQDTDNGCSRRPNGDYPACFPVCQKGVYITCSNGYTVVRECQFGWYSNPKRQRFLARIMFHPATKRCEYKTAFCPRQLNYQA